jgi:hypothetical protein
VSDCLCSFELSGRVVGFFTEVVQDIITSVSEQMQGHHVQVSLFLQFITSELDSIGKNIVLVGGFGDSQYLRRELRKCLDQSVELTLANESTWVLINSLYFVQVLNGWQCQGSCRWGSSMVYSTIGDFSRNALCIWD